MIKINYLKKTIARNKQTKKSYIAGTFLALKQSYTDNNV